MSSLSEGSGNFPSSLLGYILGYLVGGGMWLCVAPAVLGLWWVIAIVVPLLVILGIVGYYHDAPQIVEHKQRERGRRIAELEKWFDEAYEDPTAETGQTGKSWKAA
jgi:uncharacterized membrane protein